MATFEDIKKSEDIRAYITCADESLIALGYTEHSFAHVARVAETARYILSEMGYSSRDCELAQMAAWLHDIGNLVNRIDHAKSGAVMAFRILESMGENPRDIAKIVTAIGNHDEGTAVAVNPIAAALILGDKTDVRRSRVRNRDITNFDIHDRVNYSVRESHVTINPQKTTVTLTLSIDPHYCSLMDYFEIFLDRMLLCRKAAEKLNLKFQLIINGQQMV